MSTRAYTTTVEYRIARRTLGDAFGRLNTQWEPLFYGRDYDTSMDVARARLRLVREEDIARRDSPESTGAIAGRVEYRIETRTVRTSEWVEV